MGGFDTGFAWEAGRQAQAQAHKEALSDQELEGKIGELIDQRKGIQAKLPTLLDDKGQPTPEYTAAIDALTKNAQDLRNVYHPHTNPGAVSRFGHLLTDALHITKPEDRIKKEAAKREAGAAADERTAQGVAAAALISPEQQATRTYTAQLNAEIAAIKKSEMSPENQERAREALFKIYQKANNKVYKAPDGTIYAADINDPDSFIPGSVPYANPTVGNEKLQEYYEYKKLHPEYTGTIDQFEAQNKTPTSKFGMNVESYKKLHNIPPGQSLTPDQLNFVEQQIALSSGAPSTNITTSLKQDVNGMWVPITEANRHIPGFGTILADPLGQRGSSDGAGAGSKASTSPNEVKKKAEALKPKTTPSAGAGPTHVGPPLFQGRTPEISKAKGDVDAAVALANGAHAAEKASPDVKAGLQRKTAASIQNTLEKRFNQQAFDNLIHNYGIANNFQTWLDKQETGALPDAVFKQLVAIADQNLEDKKSALASAMNGPESGQVIGPDKVKNDANKIQFPSAPDIGTIEPGDDGNYRYKGGDPLQQTSWEKVNR
jgi:hypothetical protein